MWRGSEGGNLHWASTTKSVWFSGQRICKDLLTKQITEIIGPDAPQRRVMDDDDDDIDTIGGLVFLRNGSVPALGEIVRHESGAEFEVLEADPRKIKRLRMRLPGPLRADDAATADI